MSFEHRGSGFAVVGWAAIVLSSATCMIVVEKGDGGDTSTPGTSTTTSTPTWTTTTPGTSTTTTWTDPGTTTTTSGECFDAGNLACSPTEACGLCAVNGPCASYVAACLNDLSCAALNSCINACNDDGCIDDCYEGLPDGESAYEDIALCVVCDVCPLACDADNQAACAP
ncbi:hypothetical protein [Chondromyces crocatus]|uniref:Uncharacterized protein n=1 Tax=Chondromyces crocatus TaxID=52 RepID=A0A0K1E923_CHOCO|nr:hypothetical protein [Chondromyces crocatus]AKT37375.1 uncharacterized protein CMC5_015100 [Chondromyces crocatus]